MSYAENHSPPQKSSTGQKPSHAEQAAGIVRKHIYWARGLGLIPIIDFVALTGVKVKMLKELSALYEVSFTEQRAKIVVGSLTSTL
jgi:hypothetical protein